MGGDKCHIIIFILVAVLCISSIKYTSCEPYWLEEGSYVEHEFEGFIRTYGLLIGVHIQGTIRWECLEIQDGMAKIEETLYFSFPQTYTNKAGNEVINYICYYGKEYHNMAKCGDYSFITEFPIEKQMLVEFYEPCEMIDRETGEIVINEDTGLPIMMGEYIVAISNVNSIIHKNTVVVVDLETRDVYDIKGNLFGRWLWWINVDEYPLDGRVEELALYNWRGYEVPVGILYVNRDMDFVKRHWDMSFQYMVPEGTYEWFIMSNVEVPGYEGYDENNEKSIQPLTFGEFYNTNTGYLMYSDYYGLADDISLNIFGIEAFLNNSKISDTNINFSFDNNGDVGKSNATYYIAFFLLFLLMSLMVVKYYKTFG